MSGESVSGERFHRLSTTSRRLARTLSAWLSLAALAVTVWLAVELLVIHGGSRQGEALLPAVSCPDGSPASRPAAVVSEGAVNVRYSTTGCNAQPANISASFEQAFVSAQNRLSALGLAAPPTPIEAEVLAAPRAEPVLGFVAPNGGRGAMVVAGGANMSLYVLQGYAQLTVGYALPGLSVHSRLRLADAFAALAGGEGVLRQLQGQLADGDLSSGSEGLYDAWLGARYGTAFLRDALAGCREACSWPAQLDGALRQRHLSAAGLEGRFASQATSGALQNELVMALNQR